MSSFRPSPHGEHRGFEARPFEMLRKAGFAGGPVAESIVSEAGDSEATVEATAEGAEATPPEADLQRYSAEEIEALEQAAFARGAAEAAIEAEACRAALAALEAAAHAIASEVATRPLRNREAMVELSCEIATRWVEAELRVEPARVADQVERSLAVLGEESVIAVHLHPGDLEAIEAADEGRLTAWREESPLAIRADAALGRGEFRIELAQGLVDGRLDTVRRDLGDRLREALDAPLPEGAEPS